MQHKICVLFHLLPCHKTNTKTEKHIHRRLTDKVKCIPYLKKHIKVCNKIFLTVISVHKTGNQRWISKSLFWNGDRKLMGKVETSKVYKKYRLNSSPNQKKWRGEGGLVLMKYYANFSYRVFWTFIKNDRIRLVLVPFFLKERHMEKA